MITTGFLRPGARRLGCRRAPRMPGIAARACAQAPRDVAPRTPTTWPTARLRHALEHVCNAVYSTFSTWPPARLRQGLSHVHGLPSRTSAGRPRARPCYWAARASWAWPRAQQRHGPAHVYGLASCTSTTWSRPRPLQRAAHRLLHRTGPRPRHHDWHRPRLRARPLQRAGHWRSPGAVRRPWHDYGHRPRPRARLLRDSTRRAPPTASHKASTGDMTAGITYGLAHVFGNVSGRRRQCAARRLLHDDGHRPRPRARPPQLAAHRRCKATAIIHGLAHVYCGAPGTGDWATGVVHAFTLVHRDARHRRMHRARPRRRS